MSRVEGLFLAFVVILLIAGIVLMAVYLPPKPTNHSSPSPIATLSLSDRSTLFQDPSLKTALDVHVPAFSLSAQGAVVVPDAILPTPPRPTDATAQPVRILRSLTVPESATSLYWNEITRLLFVGTPEADQGCGRVYTFQLHTDLLPADDPELAFRQVRAWPFSMAGQAHQRAGYRVRDDLVVAPDSTLHKTSAEVTGALYYLNPDQGVIQRLNIYTQDQFRLADQGDIFLRFHTYLAVAKRQGDHHCRVDIFSFAPPDGPPLQLQASLQDPSLSASDFGHNIFWHPRQHRLHVATPSVGQLYGWDWNETLRQWILADTWDFSAFPTSDHSELSFWPEQNLVVLSCPLAATTYLVQYGTWQVLDTLHHLSHHKLSHQRLLLWQNNQLQLYGSQSVYHSADPIVDVEAVGSNHVVVLQASSTLVWIHV